MERKIKQALILSGAFMGAAVALLPLTSYADTTELTSPGAACRTDEDQDPLKYPTTEFCKTTSTPNGTTHVEVTVEDVIALDLEATAGTEISAYPGLLKTGTFPVRVRSALPYTISLSAEETNLIDEAEPNHMIPARNGIEAGSLGWGIKKNGEDAYSAIRQNPVVFFDSGTGVADDFTTTEFDVGVAVTDATAQGTYSTTVNVLAAVKN